MPAYRAGICGVTRGIKPRRNAPGADYVLAWQADRDLHSTGRLTKCAIFCITDIAFTAAVRLFLYAVLDSEQAAEESFCHCGKMLGESLLASLG